MSPIEELKESIRIKMVILKEKYEANQNNKRGQKDQNDGIMNPIPLQSKPTSTRGRPRGSKNGQNRPKNNQRKTENNTLNKNRKKQKNEHNVDIIDLTNVNNHNKSESLINTDAKNNNDSLQLIEDDDETVDEEDLRSVNSESSSSQIIRQNRKRKLMKSDDETVNEEPLRSSNSESSSLQIIGQNRRRKLDLSGDFSNKPKKGRIENNSNNAKPRSLFKRNYHSLENHKQIGYNQGAGCHDNDQTDNISNNIYNEWTVMKIILIQVPIIIKIKLRKNNILNEKLKLLKD